MFLSLVKALQKQHSFVQECDVTSRRYYMCFDIYNNYVRLFEEVFID